MRKNNFLCLASVITAVGAILASHAIAGEPKAGCTKCLANQCSAAPTIPKCLSVCCCCDVAGSWTCSCMSSFDCLNTKMCHE